MAALKSAGLTKKVKVVGFDGSPDAISAIKEGEMVATVLQPAALISRMAVEQADEYIKNGKASKPEKQSIDCVLVSKENADSSASSSRRPDAAALEPRARPGRAVSGRRAPPRRRSAHDPTTSTARRAPPVAATPRSGVRGGASRIPDEPTRGSDTHAPDTLPTAQDYADLRRRMDDAQPDERSRSSPTRRRTSGGASSR